LDDGVIECHGGGADPGQQGAATWDQRKGHPDQRAVADGRKGQQVVAHNVPHWTKPRLNWNTNQKHTTHNSLIIK